MNKKIKIGLFGFGCVGQGFYDIFHNNNITNAEISYICVRDKAKKRPLTEDRFIFDKEVVLNDADVSLVIELISDADEAYEIVKRALTQGKKVISANKKMIAYHLPELLELQSQFNGVLLYEGSTCGSIPIIRNLEDYFAFEEVKKIRGIFNGSSNYILSKIDQEAKPYKEALEEAQVLGFAEANPLLDVGGYDALHKLCIVVYHAFGVYVHPEQVLNLGIQNIKAGDNFYAAENNWKLKQIAFATKSDSGAVQSFVLPQFVEEREELFHIDQEFNAVSLDAVFAGSQLLKGRGAGSHPTGSAVFSDFKSILAGYNYQYNKTDPKLKHDNEFIIKIYLSSGNEACLQEVNFLNIIAKGNSNGLYYAIGEIGIGDLIKFKDKLTEGSVFIAALPDRDQNFSKRINLEEEALI